MSQDSAKIDWDKFCRLIDEYCSKFNQHSPGIDISKDSIVKLRKCFNDFIKQYPKSKNRKKLLKSLEQINGIKPKPSVPKWAIMNNVCIIVADIALAFAVGFLLVESILFEYLPVFPGIAILAGLIAIRMHEYFWAKRCPECEEKWMRIHFSACSKCLMDRIKIFKETQIQVQNNLQN